MVTVGLKNNNNVGSCLRPVSVYIRRIDIIHVSALHFPV